jgi:hypothetical protein
MKIVHIYLVTVALLMLSLANASPYFGYAQEQNRQAIFADQIDIRADGGGNVCEQTPILTGDLRAVVIENGNFTGIGNYTLNYTMPRNVTLDTYNLSSGNTIRAPRIDYNSTYPLFGKLWLNITGGEAWAQATAYIVYG